MIAYKTTFSLVLLALVAGCDKLPSAKEMRQFDLTVRQHVSASDLERWATNCIAEGIVTEDGASHEIRKLIKEGEVSIITEIGLNEPVLQFSYGGGFGRWGIAIGSPTYICRFGNVQKHWTNGIWFWHD